jgi:flagellar hook-basal body complex protein FliE
MSITPLTPMTPLSSSIVNLLADEPVAVGTADESGGSFSDILTQAFATAEATDKEDKATSLELLSGQTDDLSGLLLDAQKAEISLNLALQIRNKVVDAYNDIMRMQV